MLAAWVRTLTPSGLQGQVAVCNCSNRESSLFVPFGTATAFDATLGLATFIARARRWFLVNETCPVGGGLVYWTVSVLSPPPLAAIACSGTLTELRAAENRVKRRRLQQKQAEAKPMTPSEAEQDSADRHMVNLLRRKRRTALL